MGNYSVLSEISDKGSELKQKLDVSDSDNMEMDGQILDVLEGMLCGDNSVFDTAVLVMEKVQNEKGMEWNFVILRRL